ncbi:MAG: DUF2115 family protein [Methermicoccaceae archaeon]
MARFDIDRALDELEAVSSRTELFHLTQHIIRLYSIHDLQGLYHHVIRGLRYVPEPYRGRLLPKTLEQLFGTYQRMLAQHTPPELELLVDGGKIPSFVRDARAAIESSDDRKEALLYYLLLAYRLFVEGIPGHPEGTPFPGGKAVERVGGVYFCPVRDKEDDVPGALCKYCGAEQG